MAKKVGWISAGAQNKDPVRTGIAQAKRTLTDLANWWSEGVQLSPEGDVYETIDPDMVQHVTAALDLLAQRFTTMASIARDRLDAPEETSKPRRAKNGHAKTKPRARKKAAASNSEAS